MSSPGEETKRRLKEYITEDSLAQGSGGTQIWTLHLKKQRIVGSDV